MRSGNQCGQYSSKLHQSGVALLAALILMLAVVFSLGSIFYRHQIDITRLTKMLHGDQALLLSLSVENWASQMLSTQQDDVDVDHLLETWAMTVPALPVDGGYVMGCIVDLQSKINPNGLANYDSQRWSNEVGAETNGLAKAWLALLSYNELPHSEEFAASIVDWVDENTEPLNQWGAEQINYDNERSGKMVANKMLADFTELSVIKGYDSGVVQQLQPWAAALPRETAININTADRALLLAMGGTHANVFADFVMTGRPFYTLDAFHQSLTTLLNKTLEEVEALWPSNFVSIRSDYFQLNLRVTLGQAQLETHSIMSRYNRDVPVIIRRDVSVIPAILPILDDEEEIPDTFCQKTDLGT